MGVVEQEEVHSTKIWLTKGEESIILKKCYMKGKELYMGIFDGLKKEPGVNINEIIVDTIYD